MTLLMSHYTTTANKCVIYDEMAENHKESTVLKPELWDIYQSIE